MRNLFDLAGPSEPQDEIVVDLFAGGGGASEGIRMAVGRDPDAAVNHNPLAVAMHTANHPDTEHFVEDVWAVSPSWVTRGRPDGQPMAKTDQVRMCGNSVCPPMAAALVRANVALRQAQGAEVAA